MGTASFFNGCFRHGNHRRLRITLDPHRPPDFRLWWNFVLMLAKRFSAAGALYGFGLNRGFRYSCPAFLPHPSRGYVTFSAILGGKLDYSKSPIQIILGLNRERERAAKLTELLQA